MARPYNMLTQQQRQSLIEWVREGLDYTAITGRLVEKAWPLLSRQAVSHYRKTYSDVTLSRFRKGASRLSKYHSELKPESSPQGYVYVFHMEGGFYKVGVAKDVQERLKKFLTLPYRVHLVCAIQCRNAYQIETMLHQRFADKHVIGEWYRLSGRDIRRLKSARTCQDVLCKLTASKSKSA